MIKFETHQRLGGEFVDVPGFIVATGTEPADQRGCAVVDKRVAEAVEPAVSVLPTGKTVVFVFQLGESEVGAFGQQPIAGHADVALVAVLVAIVVFEEVAGTDVPAVGFVFVIRIK